MKTKDAPIGVISERSERPEWANAIRTRRVAAKLSQKALGERIGASQTTVASWETGQNTPSFEVIQRLAGVFEVNPSDLAWPSADPASYSPVAKTLLDTLNGSSDFEEWKATADILQDLIVIIEELRLQSLFTNPGGGKFQRTEDSKLLNTFLQGALMKYRDYRKTRPHDEALGMIKQGQRLVLTDVRNKVVHTVSDPNVFGVDE